MAATLVPKSPHPMWHSTSDFYFLFFCSFSFSSSPPPSIFPLPPPPATRSDPSLAIMAGFQPGNPGQSARIRPFLSGKCQIPARIQPFWPGKGRIPDCSGRGTTRSRPAGRERAGPSPASRHSLRLRFHLPTGRERRRMREKKRERVFI
jgi:hypothetical protein